MRLADVGAVYAKELRETLRDRRTLLVMVALPLLLYPLVGYVVTEVLAAHHTDRERHPSAVAVVGTGPAAERIRTALGRAPGLTVRPGDVEALRRHEIGAVLVLPANVDARLAAGQTTPLRLLSDEADDDSRLAASRLQEALAELGRTEASAALRARGLPPELARPFEVKTENVARKERMGGYVLSLVLPMVTVLMVILGAFYPAIDVTAGEKERGTLETILCAPVDRRDLVTGKFLCVATIALFAAILNLLSLGVTAMTLMPRGDLAVRVPWGAVPPVLAALVPAALLFGAVMMAVAALARSFKEAQNALTPVYLAFAVPTMVVTLLPGVRLGWALAVVPGINVSLLVKDLMRGEAALGPALLACAASVAYALAALRFAAAVFDSERLLFAGEGVGGFLRRRRRPPRADDASGHGGGGPDGEPPPGGDEGGPGTPPRPASRAALGASEALLLYAATFIAIFLVGSRAQAWRLYPGLLITEYLLILVPVLLYLRQAGVDLRSGLGLARPRPVALLGALLCGLSSWYLVIAFVEVAVERVLPIPKEVIQELHRVVGSRPLWIELLVVAITPAICEEVLFRGAILRALLTRLGRPSAVVLTAILFGLFHFSIYRFVPTALIGVVVGVVAVQSRSLWPAMVVHATNNGMAIVLAHLAPEAAEKSHRDPRLAVAAALTLVVGLALVGVTRKRESGVGANR